MNQLHLPFSISGCHEDPYVFISAFETWLLQFSTVRFSTVSHPAISESSKYSCSDYSQSPRTEHTSPLLLSLHWLPVQKRIKHKVCSICYTTLTGASPKYMSELCQCMHSIQMPALIIRWPYSDNPLCENQDLWAAFLCLSRTSTWNEPPFDLRHRFTVHFQNALKTHLFHHPT